MEIDYTAAARAQASVTSHGTLNAKPMAELERVTDRLAKLVDMTRGMGGRLHSHADRLMGERPTGKGEVSSPRPVRSGMFGALEDLIDSLDDALSHVNDGVERNTTLA